MKVHGSPRPGPVDVQKSGQSSGTRRGATRPSQGEQVDVSSGAQALQAAREPEVPDQLRIARLKEAIRQGTFSIDVDRIAEAMIQEEL